MLFCSLLIFGLACDDEEEKPPPPPTPPSFAYIFDNADACNAVVPLPNDLFTSDNLTDERSACPGPSDPVEAAIYAVLQHEGANLDAEISIPLVNTTLDISSVVNQTPFSLTSSAATSSTSDSLPPLILIGRASSSTKAADWQTVEYDARVETTRLVIIPREPLIPATHYVLVATDAVLTSEKKAIEAALSTGLLLGSSVIGASKELSAASAAKMERERNRLLDARAVLAQAFPPVSAERIRSIHGWRTTLGPEKVKAVVQTYYDAVNQGRYSYKVSTEGGDIPPGDVLQQGSPTDNLKNFRRGTITVPNILDANGRIRANWATSDTQTTELPFLISIPDTARPNYPVTVLLPGYGRSKEDAAFLANEFGGGSQSAVLGLDLDYHGARSIDLTDNGPNNDNPTINGADGVPDNSGNGFFQGAPGQLRDRMIANIIEVLHVIETLKDGDAFEAEMITPDNRASQLHIIGHGHSAATALHVALRSTVGTVQLPSGGADIEHLIVEGPANLRAAFLASVPSGVNETNLNDYLGKLKNSVFKGLAIKDAGDEIRTRYINRSAPKVLLSYAAASEFVPDSARNALIDDIQLPNNRVSQHQGTFCDDFFLYTCTLGQNSAIVKRAQEQLATFVSSGGVTVKSPAL